MSRPGCNRRAEVERARLSVLSYLISINSSQEHLSRALYIVRYLGLTKNLALLFNGANHDRFLGYTDSDWTANPDDQKSITGYVLFLANSPVSW